MQVVRAIQILRYKHERFPDKTKFSCSVFPVSMVISYANTFGYNFAFRQNRQLWVLQQFLKPIQYAWVTFKKGQHQDLVRSDANSQFYVSPDFTINLFF